MYSIWPRVRFSGSPLHSRALMPNKEVKKERGRKLDGVVISGLVVCVCVCGFAGVYWGKETTDIMVNIVKTMTDRD